MERNKMFVDFADLSIFLLRFFSIDNKEATNRFLKLVIYKMHPFFIDYVGLYAAIVFYAIYHQNIVKNSAVGIQ